MNVPFLDLQAINARFADELARAHIRVVASGWFLRGAETRAFEEEFAAWNDSAHCVGMANGLDALRLVLEAWKLQGRLQPGDEVVVPANSFVASALAVTQAGLAVRLADVDPASCNVTTETLMAALTPRTRVVMPVHLFGRMVDVDAIRRLCDERGLLMLEDAAQAHGAADGKYRAGNAGHAGIFSFYPVKNLGALGDAGCVVTHDEDLAARVRMLGNYGSATKYEHVALGVNSRIDELQAAFLRAKLPLLASDNARRRAIAARYKESIAHPHLSLPTATPVATSHVWHLFVVATPRRASLATHLAGEGVETMVHYPRAIHRQPAYAAALADTVAPVADRLQHEVLSLPMSPVMSDAQVDHVIHAVNAWPHHDEGNS